MSNDSNVIKVEKGHLQSWKLREKCIQTFILINSYGQKSWSYQCLGTALIITKKISNYAMRLESRLTFHVQ